MGKSAMKKKERMVSGMILFIVDGCNGRTMAELDPEEKNKISHRANALKEFAKKLKV